MRDHKPEVQHHKQHGGHADDHAFFERAQVLQISSHWTSARLSSRVKFQLTVAVPGFARQVTFSPFSGSNNGCLLSSIALRMAPSKALSSLTSSLGAVPLRVNRLPSLKFIVSRVILTGISLAVTFQQFKAAYFNSWRSFRT